MLAHTWCERPEDTFRLCQTVSRKGLTIVEYSEFELRQPCKARKIQRSGDMNHGDDDRSVTTTASGSSPFKVELLQENKLRNLYGGQFTALVRCHILSFHSSSKKFKAYAGVQRVDENFAKYSLACTCNTGTRLTGCVHSTLIVYLFSHYLKLSQ